MFYKSEKSAMWYIQYFLQATWESSPNMHAHRYIVDFVNFLPHYFHIGSIFPEYYYQGDNFDDEKIKQTQVILNKLLDLPSF